MLNRRAVSAASATLTVSPAKLVPRRRGAGSRKPLDSRFRGNDEQEAARASGVKLYP